MVNSPNSDMFGLVAASLLGAGCASTNPALEEATAAFEAAEDDPQVIAKAPVELQYAEAALQKAHDSEETEEREHRAYLARQRVTIAREAARLRAARQVLREAEQEHGEVAAQVQNSGTEQARRLAEYYEQEAERAYARIEKLSARIDALQTQKTDRGLVLTLGDVLFESGSARLRDSATRTMSRLSNVLEEYPDRKLLVEGYTDSVGSDEYNERLSRQRAQAVAEALVKRGRDPQRVGVRGYGELYPRAGNDTAAGRMLNRRVEIVVAGEDGEFERRRMSRQ